MATIRKRGNKYHVQIRKQGFEPRTKSFLLLKDAQAWARKIESEMERSIFICTSEAQKLTVAEIVTKYETEILPSTKSYSVYIHHLKPLKRILGHLLLASLKSSHVSQYRDTRLQSVSSATVLKEVSLLSRVLDACMKEFNINLPYGNVVKQVRLPRQPQGRDRRLQVGEQERLLEALKDTPMVKDIVQLALETAMRREEITNIHWKDIDFKAKTLHIPKTKTDTPPAYGRPGIAGRTIPLSSKAIAVLHGLRPSYGEGLPRRIDGRVFEINPHSITVAFTRACKRAGIGLSTTGPHSGHERSSAEHGCSELHFHDLRHEATSRLFELGFNIMEVSCITGHKDLRMLKRYCHLRAEDLVERLG